MPKTYKVELHKSCTKDLKKIPQTNKKQIQKSILALANTPRPEGFKKLKGAKDPLYRIRCGDYRVVYTIRDKVLLVIVIEIGHRKDIYRQ